MEVSKKDKLEKVLNYAEKEKGFIRGCGDDARFDFSAKELKKLGWEFDPHYDSISEAQGISYENAIEYFDNNQTVVICVDELGHTKWFSYNNNPKSKWYNEESDSEPTGDDGKTIKDIIELEEIN